MCAHAGMCAHMTQYKWGSEAILSSYHVGPEDGIQIISPYMLSHFSLASTLPSQKGSIFLFLPSSSLSPSFPLPTCGPWYLPLCRPGRPASSTDVPFPLCYSMLELQIHDFTWFWMKEISPSCLLCRYFTKEPSPQPIIF